MSISSFSPLAKFEKWFSAVQLFASKAVASSTFERSNIGEVVKISDLGERKLTLLSFEHGSRNSFLY